MKKLLLFFAVILTVNSYSQISFEKGYYIDNSNQKTECLIKNNDWATSPIDFKYTLSENGEIKTIGIESVKEFGIYGSLKYIRAVVQVDISNDYLDNMSKDKNPELKEQQLFLKVLIEGKANLYTGVNSSKYFYNVDHSAIEELIHKNYIIQKTADSEKQIETNNEFRKQLWDNLKCESIRMDDLLKLEYKQTPLINVFSEYNKCSNSETINYTTKQQHKDLFNLTLKARINNSSLSIQNYTLTSKNTDFGNKTTFGFGVETEFILPFNKNKWSLFVEPTYNSFEAEKTNPYSFLVAGPLTAQAKFSSIEIPFGARYYFFLNKNSKLFLDAAFMYDFALNSTIKFIKSDNSTYSTLDVSNSSNFAFGIGYKLYDKFSIEMRYHTSRNSLANHNDWNSDYKTTSILLGYTLF